ncbi:MAG: GNAT family N-acetyltransferase [Clostridia bacterium]|nr:GNAT family N-acetyltransferase [Clostridia bacterium]
MRDTEETLYGMLERVALKHPDDMAIIMHGRKISFGEFLRMVHGIAGMLPEGVKSCGIIMTHSAEMVAAIFAVLERGAMYVPAESGFPKGRIHEMMSSSAVDVIITEPEYADLAEGFPQVYVQQGEIPYIEKDTYARERVLGAGLPAYVLYTSGTTGHPKGVMVSNGNVCNYVRAFANEFRPGPGDVMLQHSVCSFDIMTEEIFASLLNGAALAIPTYEEQQDIRATMRFVQETGCTIISGFPYLLEEINLYGFLPSSVRLLISGGDVLRASYVKDLVHNVAVYNTYGPSETTVCASYYNCSSGSPLEDGTYPIGRPVLGVQIQLLSPDGTPVPAGEKGEICISGNGVSLGYINADGSSFQTMPDGSRMYHSGDMGCMLPDGNLAFLGRKDKQVMIYGKRVEPEEVEGRLCQCSNVRKAVCLAHTDPEGLAYLTAYIVPQEGSICLEALKEELSHYLTPYMIPEFFIQMPDIPVTPNGKPDVSRLPVPCKEARWRPKDKDTEAESASAAQDLEEKEGADVTVQLLQAAAEDLTELMEWRMEVLRDVFWMSPQDPRLPSLREENRKYYEETIPQGAHIACWAVLDGKKTGCGGLCLQKEMPSPDNRTGVNGYIMNVYVRKEYRGHGIGHAILSWLISKARENGAGKIYLETTREGRPLYTSLGFEDMWEMMKLEK